MKTVKKIMLPFCLIFFSVGFVAAQDATSSAATKYAEKLTSKMAQELFLKGELLEKVKPINLEYAQKVMKYKAQFDEESDELAEKMTALKAEQLAALKEVLPEGTMQEWETFVSEISARPGTRASDDFEEIE